MTLEAAAPTPAAPPLSPSDANVLDDCWFYEIDWWHDRIVPDYSDVDGMIGHG